MQIALVNPGLRGYRFGDIGELSKAPLGLGLLASYLEKHDIEVCIVDEIAGADAIEELSKLQPDAVGITGMTMFIPEAYRIADYVRENLDSKVILGGVHAFALPEEAAKHADVVVVGEGERALLEVIEEDISSGIVSRPFIKDIDGVPMPARHLMDMDFYLSRRDQIAGMKLKTLSIISSRGCPYECVFCVNSCKMVPVRFHSAKRILDEIKFLIDSYGIDGLAFTDDCFTMNNKRLKDICEGMISEKFDLVWECQTRADQISRDMLKLMKRAGCEQVGIGFESGSQRILDILNKKTTVEKNRKALKLIKKAGLRVRGCFMIGNPTETLEDIELTRRFIQENDVDFVGIFITTVYPGTRLWEMCKERGVDLSNTDYSVFTTGLEAPPLACDTISWDKLKEFHSQLTVEAFFRNYSLLQLIQRSLRYPKVTLNYLKSYLGGLL